MGFEEAVEALKARDPRLVVQLAGLCAAVDAAKAANDPTPAWDRMEAAIVALLKSTGADDELFERQVQEGRDAAGVGMGKTTREDLDDANLRYSDRGVVFLQAAITRLLMLPIGIAGTRAGKAAAGSLLTAANGFDPWLFGRAKHQGGDSSTDSAMVMIAQQSVLAEAARLMVHTAMPRKTAIRQAIATHGGKAARYGIRLDPELLRQRTSRRAKSGSPDPLHIFFENRLEYERGVKGRVLADSKGKFV
jgi:hypothetical protein